MFIYRICMAILLFSPSSIQHILPGYMIPTTLIYHPRLSKQSFKNITTKLWQTNENGKFHFKRCESLRYDTTRKTSSNLYINNSLELGRWNIPWRQHNYSFDLSSGSGRKKNATYLPFLYPKYETVLWFNILQKTIHSIVILFVKNDQEITL